MTGEQKTLPYELLAEQMADEALAKFIARFGKNPHVWRVQLRAMLHEAIHDGIDTGFGLAGFHEYDIAGPSEVLGAYSAGFEAGKNEAGNE